MKKKNESNFKKHGYKFNIVPEIFENKYITFEDIRRDYGERRFVTIGKYKETVIVSVCHTERAGLTRIISVRRASKKERSLYYGPN